MEQATYNEATILRRCQQHSMGNGSLTTRSHYTDQCSSPGHFPCPVVSLSSRSSSGSPCLLHTTIQPQPTSLKPQSTPLHASADYSPRPGDVLCALMCYVFVSATQKVLCSHLCQSLTSLSGPNSNQIIFHT